MSDIHVHGVVLASARVEGPQLIAHGDVAALVSDVESLTAARVLRGHWHVLEQAAATATVLPVRFGTVMASDEAVVADFLEPRHDGLAATLRELDGKVQLTVKGSYDEEALLREVVAGSPEIARARRQQLSHVGQVELGRMVAAEVERARERDTALVLDRLEPLAAASLAEQAAGIDFDAAFLVDRSRIDAFATAVGELGRELAGRLALRCVGPLPLYSFTTEEAAAWA